MPAVNAPPEPETGKVQASAADTEYTQAAAAARATGVDVPLGSRTTATTQFWVTPGGDERAEIYPEPVRVQRAGGWVDVDTTLHRVGHHLEPVAGVTDVRVFPTNPDRVVVARSGQVRAGLGLAGGPATSPVAHGTTVAWATGQNVAVDTEGTTVSWPVHTTHRVPRGQVIARIPAPISGGSWQELASGGVRVLDTAGHRVFSTPAVYLLSNRLDHHSGDPARAFRLRARVHGRGNHAVLVLVSAVAVPAGFTGRAAISISQNAADTWIQTPDFPTSQQSSKELKAGTYDDGVHVARSFMNFATSPFLGSKVKSAKLVMSNFWSGSCQGSDIQVRQLTSAWNYDTLTWSTQPLDTPTGMAVFAPAYGWTSCPAEKNATWDVTDIADAWSNGAPDHGLMVRAASEKTTDSWRRYRSANYQTGDTAIEPHLNVTYDPRPVLTSLRTQPALEQASNGTWYLMAADTSFIGTASDVQGDPVRIRVDAYSGATLLRSMYSGYGPPGTDLWRTLDTDLGLVRGQPYRFVVRASDGVGLGLDSAWERTLVYNRIPNTPNTTAVTGTNSDHPVFTTTFTDPDPGQQLTAECTATGPTTISSGQFQVAYGDHQWQWPGAGLADGTWTLTCRVRNTTDTTPAAWSAWSPGFGFTIDTTPPSPPSITASGWPAGPGWVDNQPADNVFTFHSGGVPAHFNITLDGASMDAVPADGAGNGTMRANPPSGMHTLLVSATDASGNTSAPSSFNFGWGGAGITSPLPQTRSSRTFRVTASAPPGMGDATIYWRVAGTSDPWTAGTTFPTTQTGMATELDQVWDTTAGTGAIGQKTRPALIEMKVSFAHAGGPREATVLVQVTGAFGGSYAGTGLGPGEVSLPTGEFRLSATDAVMPGFLDGLSVGRVWDSQSDLSPTTPRDGDLGVFGPGWTAALPTPDSGVVGATITGTPQAGAANRYVVVTLPGGSAGYYTYNPTAEPSAPMTGDVFTPLGLSRLGGAVVVATDPDTLVYLDGGEKTTFKLLDGKWVAVSAAAPGAHVQSALFRQTIHNDVTGVDEVHIAAVSGINADGDTCSSVAAAAGDTPVSTARGMRGCRVLDLILAATTTATANQPGAVAGQADRVEVMIWDPQKANMDPKTVSRYAYNTAGRLVSQWDPRLSDIDDTPASRLATSYGYGQPDLGPAGTWLITSVTPPARQVGGEPALAGWTITYTAHNQDPVRVASVTRAQAKTGGDTATSTVVYDVALSGDSLPDLRDVSAWAGTHGTQPTHAAAIFGPDATSLSDYRQATLAYFDTLGRATNTATYGAGRWLIDTIGYDDGDGTPNDTGSGAPVWSLSAANRELAIAATCTAGAVVCGRNTTPERADLLADITELTTHEPVRVTDTFGPAVTTVDDTGASVTTRAHTHYGYASSYDPDQQPPKPEDDQRWTDPHYQLPTSLTTGGTQLDGLANPNTRHTSRADVDEETTEYGYDQISGGASGWELWQDTSTTTDMGDEEDLITTTKLDKDGLAVVITPAGSTGLDAATIEDGYYQAKAGAGPCDGHPEWAGLSCTNRQAADPGTGSITTPDTLVTGYTWDLQPTTTTQTSGTVTRTTATSYDTVGRITVTQVTGGAVGDLPVPETTTSYDPDTGLAVQVTAGGKSLTAGYDRWGQVVSYTDATGKESTTSYDTAGRVVTTNDSVADTTWAYNNTDLGEFRGLPTKVTYSGLGVDIPNEATATWAPDGTPTTVLPNGLTHTSTTDPAGNTTTSTYTNPTRTTLATWNTRLDAHGRMRDITSQLTGLTRRAVYTYDQAGRLIRGDDTINDACTIREYGYHTNSTRPTTTTTPDSTPGAGATPCTGGPDATSIEREFNAYGQVLNTKTIPVTSGTRGTPRDQGDYTYDPLGRVASMPPGDTPAHTDGDSTHPDSPTQLGYYADDTLAASGYTNANNWHITLYDIDPAGRTQRTRLCTPTTTQAPDFAAARTWCNTATPPDAQDTTNHYSDDSDSPTTTTNPDGQTTRYLTGPEGGIAIIATGTGSTWTLTTPITSITGNLVSSTPLTTNNDITPNSLDPYNAYDEYGNPTGPNTTPRNSTTTPTYGWHGNNQRPTNPTTGLTTLGARTYNPTTGQFLTTDPMQGGNPTPYTYPTDPINQNDDSGQASTAIMCVLGGPLGCAAISTSISLWVLDKFHGRDNPILNAKRHFIWNLMLVGRVGYRITRMVTGCHERNRWCNKALWRAADIDLQDSAVDRHNNAYALSYGPWAISKLTNTWSSRSRDYAILERLFNRLWRDSRSRFWCRPKGSVPGPCT